MIKTYMFYLIAGHGTRDGAARELLTCETDAQALSAACKIFSRDPDIEVIEVWEGARWVVDLGGRKRTGTRP